MKEKSQQAPRSTTEPAYFAVVYVLSSLAVGVAEYLLGRTLFCPCGTVKLWYGGTESIENSQHLTDWYTFSHVSHGFAFFYLSRWLFKKWTVFQHFMFALGLEAVWEVVENGSVVINYYREHTVSADYNGDSIVNSAVDIGAMAVGFYLAKKFPVWMVGGVFILMELGVAWAIRDNLLLNILMFIYPSSAIRQWQMGS